MTQGELAQEAGERLFKELEYHLSDVCGLEYMSFDDFRRRRPGLGGRPVLVRGVPYVNLYGNAETKHKLSIVFNKHFYRVECQGQQVGGTADQKLPWLLMNAEKCHDHVIIILEGEGFQQGAKEWLARAAEASERREFITVCWSVDEGRETLSALLVKLGKKTRLDKKPPVW